MNAEQALTAGDIHAALADLQGRIKQNPADAKLRVFLFQLLAVMGRWERALTQLNVAGELNSANLAMVNTYREALRCEVFRAQVFSGQRDPLLFGTPEPWVALLVEALRLAAQDRVQESQTLREQAFEQAPATAGTIDGEPFAWIADADQRLGPVLEAIINGRYYLVPFHTIRALVLEAPTDLRDLVWTPAHITWTNEGETVALIPARYPGSESSEDDRIKLAWRTEWTAGGADLFLGHGQRMLITDAGEYPWLETRRIELAGEPDGTTAA
ncbi:type VI secretion system accessory protein TagJ [Candidatus Thiosymbion oneisti]|uniref:type VI secretion system accessory protein TagJ n=1 Tax=Candidatus Thiosymbion oneisti TaxID=589554 RepID=UPI000AB1187B|nr:type VI secretion system accessory protein TagJ [Candidatus Thiosymbion oneisti]